MSVYGKGFPYYKVDDEEIAVPLNHARILMDSPEPDILVHDSEIGGSRSSFVKGERWQFEVQINLFKYENAGLKLRQFYDDLGKDNILIYRNLSGGVIEDDTNQPLWFTMTEVIPAHLRNVGREFDMVILKFTSNEFTNNQIQVAGAIIAKAQTVAMNTAYNSASFYGVHIEDKMLIIGSNSKAGTYRIDGIEDGTTAPSYYSTVAMSGNVYTPSIQPAPVVISTARSFGGLAFLPVQADKIYSRSLSLNAISGSANDDHNIPNYFNSYFHKARNLLYVAAGHKGLHIFEVGDDGTLESPFEPAVLTNYQGQYLAVSPYGNLIAVSMNFGAGVRHVAIFNFDGETITELDTIAYGDTNYPRSLAWDRWGHLCIAKYNDGFDVYDIDPITGESTWIQETLATRNVQLAPFKGDIICSYDISSLGRMRVFTMLEDGSTVANEQLQSARSFKDISPAVGDDCVVQIMNGTGVTPDLEIFEIL